MQEENNKPAQTIVEEGEKVTGGEGATNEQASDANSNSANAPTQQDTELRPDNESKKEDMTSYNEHPDQEKVGGG